MRPSSRAFVERCDFGSSIDFGDGTGDRDRLGLRGSGPRWLITDLGVLEPNVHRCELQMVALHPGVTGEQCIAATGRPLTLADQVDVTSPVTGAELEALRAQRAAT